VIERHDLVVGPAEDGRRLDVFLAERLPGASRSRLQELIRSGDVLLAGLPARPASRVTAGNRVSVSLTLPATADPPLLLPSPDVPLTVLHEDASIVVVDKAPGVVAHPALGHRRDTLVNALLARFPDLTGFGGSERPGIVHRLDRDTSGVMVVARDPVAAAHLRAQFKARTVEKTYLALVRGALRPLEGVIDAPIGRDPKRRQRMAALPGGKPARTVYRVLAESEGYAWLEARPETGRTHQLRVHLAALGHPLAGDRVYGRRDRLIGRTALHAWRLAFDHPVSGARVAYEAAPAADLLEALAALRLAWP